MVIIHINIITPYSTFTLTSPTTARVWSLNERIAERCGIDHHRQKLYFNGAYMNLPSKLDEYGLTGGETIMVEILKECPLCPVPKRMRTFDACSNCGKAHSRKECLDYPHKVPLKYRVIKSANVNEEVEKEDLHVKKKVKTEIDDDKVKKEAKIDDDKVKKEGEEEFENLKINRDVKKENEVKK